MMEFLVDRTTVVSLAVIGGAFSVLATWCNSRGSASEQTIKVLTKISYVIMGISMVLFVLAGLWSVEK